MAFETPHAPTQGLLVYSLQSRGEPQVFVSRVAPAGWRSGDRRSTTIASSITASYRASQAILDQATPKHFPPSPLVGRQKESYSQAATQKQLNADITPSQAPIGVVIQMDSLLDSLRILSYHKNFLSQHPHFPPLDRTYFNNPSKNTNEQFFYFASLCHWLCKVCGNGKGFDAPSQFDDPNATISNILSTTKALHVPFEGGPSRLKSGSGDGNIALLTTLAEKALSTSGFKFEKPVHKVEDFAEEAAVDTVAEVTVACDDMIDERLVGDGAGDEDEMYVGASGRGTDKTTLTIKASIQSTEWKLELERATPLLRVQISNDNKDWRIHLDQITIHHTAIKKVIAITTENLSTLSSQIVATLEKISSREKYINTQFEAQTDAFKSLSESLSNFLQKAGVGRTSVDTLANDLSRISEELDDVKRRMDDIGNGMTDSKPLLNIKQGFTRLKSEVKQMDLRAGVIQHTLLAAKMKAKGGSGDRGIFSPGQVFAIHA